MRRIRQRKTGQQELFSLLKRAAMASFEKTLAPQEKGKVIPFKGNTVL